MTFSSSAWNVYRQGLLVLSFVTGIFLVHGQSETFTQIITVPVKGQSVVADNLGDLYLTRGSEILKYSGSSGAFVMKESQNRLGEISSIDASNALKMLVFFRDLSQVAFVDNRLALRGDVVQLDEFGYPQTSAVCISYNNGFWVFDQVTFELARLDEQLNVTNRTSNLLQLLRLEVEPQHMFESSRYLYLSDPENGVFVFDLFGTFYKRIPIIGVEKFTVTDKHLFFLKDQELHVYDFQTLETESYPLPVPQVQDLTLYKDRIALLTPDALCIYTIHL